MILFIHFIIETLLNSPSCWLLTYTSQRHLPLCLSLSGTKVSKFNAQWSPSRVILITLNHNMERKFWRWVRGVWWINQWTSGLKLQICRCWELLEFKNNKDSKIAFISSATISLPLWQKKILLKMEQSPLVIPKEYEVNCCQNNVWYLVCTKKIIFSKLNYKISTIEFGNILSWRGKGSSWNPALP